MNKPHWMVFPARAGMILIKQWLGRKTLSIPRESGDDPTSHSPPQPQTEVFPARAGMIRRAHPRPHHHRRIPRESGDDPYHYPASLGLTPYSPRERG